MIEFVFLILFGKLKVMPNVLCRTQYFFLDRSPGLLQPRWQLSLHAVSRRVLHP